MSTPTDEELDLLLSEGGVSGARRDRMFDAVMAASDTASAEAEANAAAQPTTTSPAGGSGLRAWWDKLWRPLLVLGPVAAVVAFTLLPDGDDFGFQHRGTASSSVPFVSASCGAKDTPCVVGQPVFLRLHSLQPQSVVQVVLATATGTTSLAQMKDVGADSESALDVKLIPEESDVATGLTLHTRDARGDVLSTLRLHVVGAAR